MKSATATDKVVENDTLNEMIQASLPTTAFQVEEGRGLFMEVMDPTTKEIWMCATAVSREEFKALNPEPPFIKTGTGRASMDAAAFRHCPEGEGVPVKVKMIDGYRFIHVAVPGEMTPPADTDMPTHVTVTKGHTLGFKEGRTIKVLSIGDQYFVETIGDASDDDALKPPPGGSFSEIVLERPWIAHLPYPTTTYFWFRKGDPRSFQGPVELPGA